MDALRIPRSLCLSVRWIWDTEVMVMKGNEIVIAQAKVRFVDRNMLSEFVTGFRTLLSLPVICSVY